MADKRTVFILSANSDIGRYFMDRYLDTGATVIGTYRKPGSLKDYADRPDVHLIPLDLNDPDQIQATAAAISAQGLHWDTFVACNGTMEPIGPFMTLDGMAWQQSITTNALMPCRLVQALYPLRKPGTVNSVAFLAGGGTNNPFTNYSAYCLSKILLIKMCELLDDEAPDLKTFILGPGYFRTKIHEETLRAGDEAGENLEKTLKFLETEGTPKADIYACLEWCVSQPRSVIGGRNISVAHDPWRDGGEELAATLTADPNRYKLRRNGNT